MFGTIDDGDDDDREYKNRIEYIQNDEHFFIDNSTWRLSSAHLTLYHRGFTPRPLSLSVVGLYVCVYAGNKCIDGVGSIQFVPLSSSYWRRKKRKVFNWINWIRWLDGLHFSHHLATCAAAAGRAYSFIDSGWLLFLFFFYFCWLLKFVLFVGLLFFFLDGYTTDIGVELQPIAKENQRFHFFSPCCCWPAHTHTQHVATMWRQRDFSFNLNYIGIVRRSVFEDSSHVKRADGFFFFTRSTPRQPT